MTVATHERIEPQKGPQEAFLTSKADIVIYGGAAGGGKTFGLLLQALKHIDNPGFNGVIFRRTSSDIRKEGSIWDQSRGLYPIAGGHPREQMLDWTFPSGASITLSGLQHESDLEDWKSSQICYLAFDELTTFTERMFWYMFSRNRSTCGVRPYIRGGTNPDPDSWVYNLVGPWVNPEHPKYGARDGEVLWIKREDDEIKWVPEGTQGAKSITFIKALVFDNKILTDANPEYVDSLEMLNNPDKQALLHGSWQPIEDKRALWKRSDIAAGRIGPSEFVREGSRIVIGLDPATTSKEKTSDDTALCVRAKIKEHFFTLQTESGVYTPAEWARLAVKLYHRWGAACIAAESNQGGEMISHAIHSVDPTVLVKLVHSKDGKYTRAEPSAILAEEGRDHMVGTFPKLEAQMTRWVPNAGMDSPNDLDAYVIATTELAPQLTRKRTAPQTVARSYI